MDHEQHPHRLLHGQRDARVYGRNSDVRRRWKVGHVCPERRWRRRRRRWWRWRRRGGRRLLPERIVVRAVRWLLLGRRLPVQQRRMRFVLLLLRALLEV